MTTVPGVYGVIGLRVPGAINYRHLAIRLVSTACKMALEADQGEEDGDFESEVVSAFGEAFNNIAVHSFRDLSPEPVQIEVDWDEEKLVITFIDTGRSFDPHTVAPPDLDELPEHGMGLFIMKSCMDEVDYRAGPPNVLRLVKHRMRRDGLLPPSPGPGAGPSSAPVPVGLGSCQDGASLGTPSLPDGAPERGDRGSGVEWAGGDAGSGIKRARGPEGDDRMVESSRRR